MVGKLIVTFCEREKWGSHKAIELWAYPDGTLNLVVARGGQDEGSESSFPCMISQLWNVLEGHPVEFEHGDAHVTIDECEGLICASFHRNGDGWRQCIEMTVFEEGLEQAMILSPCSLV
jgi:hypothetical protein